MRRGDKTEAVFDHLSWFIWLNSLAVFGLAKAGHVWRKDGPGLERLPVLLLLCRH